MLVATEWLREAVLRQYPGTAPGNWDEAVDLAELLTMIGLEAEWVRPPAVDGDIVLAGVAAVPGENELVLDCGDGRQLQVPRPSGEKVATGSVVACCRQSGRLISSGHGLESDWLRFGRDDAAGIGQPVLAWLGLDKDRLELSPTPDRGDCLSVTGLAREVGAALGFAIPGEPRYEPEAEEIEDTISADMKPPGTATGRYSGAGLGPGIPEEPRYEPEAEEIEDTISVNIKPGTATGRYCGRVLRGIDISAPSPRWLKNRLLAAGISSSYCAVDVSNYIMLELGQPMHIFDAARISGGITVRWARAGETIRLLDSRQISLRPDCLLIADRKEPLALAGIMGGAASAVSDTTCDVFLESALFLPAAISGRPMRYDLHTDSSHRFERGVDSTIQRKALEAATTLLKSIAGGAAGPVSELSRSRLLPRPGQIKMRHERLEKITGERFDYDTVDGYLRRLNLQPGRRGRVYSVKVPPYRNDLENDDDIVAEVLRLHGYDKVEARAPESSLPSVKINVIQEVAEILSSSLSAIGYQEICSSTFRAVAPGAVPDPAPAVIVSNPMSEPQGAMRTSLWPGLISCLNYNSNRGQELLRLFEAGTIFTASGEDFCVAGISSGFLYKNQWNSKEKLIDFYDMKMDLQNIFSSWGGRLDFAECSEAVPALHPGRCAELVFAGQKTGVMGELHPAVAATATDNNCPIYLFEFSLKNIKLAEVPQCREVARYPGIRRDISLSVAEDIKAGEIVAYLEKLFREEPPELAELVLDSVAPFDVFYPDKEAGRKSIAIRLIYRKKDGSMTDREADIATETVVASVTGRFSAVRR